LRQMRLYRKGQGKGKRPLKEMKEKMKNFK
jgi:hypothetical protein